MRSSRDRSCSSLSFTRRHFSVVGTLVKRETTSKLTKMSLGCRVRLLVISTNWLELDTWCWVRPARGRKILARYRAVLYVGEPLEATIVRRGTSGLWIFGCPKNLGQDELEGLRCRYSWMVRASARWRARSLLATLFSMDGMGFFLRGRYEPSSPCKAISFSNFVWKLATNHKTHIQCLTISNIQYLPQHWKFSWTCSNKRPTSLF